jgi:catecholate siderophore receptor
VNGGCAATGTNPNCSVDPEEAQNTEIGGKWDAMGGDLSLTAAIFRNERSKYRVSSGIPGEDQVLDGESRVDGLSLGVTGALTDKWTVFANYTFLDSEVLQNISDDDVIGGEIDVLAGSPLPVTPEHSGSLWTTYQLLHGLLLGYGATYTGEMTFNRASATAPNFYTDAYWIHRAMASYEVNDNLAVQLNVSNLTDEEYFQRIRNNAGNGWATPGDARAAVLSLTYRR